MRRLFAVFLAVFGLLTASLTPAQEGFAPTRSAAGDILIDLHTVGLITCLRLPEGVTLATPPASLTPEQRAGVRVFTGTGTIIARNRILTAAHVVKDMDMCAFKGQVLRLVYMDERLDTAVAVADLGVTSVAPVSCDGLQSGQEYLGIGFAGGLRFALQRLSFAGAYGDVPLMSGDIARHQARMGGTAHPGMSGGPIINGAGEVVAIINIGGTNSTGARDLTETPLCAALNWSSRP